MKQFEDPREIKVGVGKSFLSVENRLYLEQGCEQDDESGTLEELIEAMTFHYDKVKQHGMAFESFTLFPITCKNGGLKIAATR